MLGAITAGVAIYGALTADDAAGEAAKDANRANAASLAFERKKYDDWKAIYGNIEENLGKFYESLTPEKLTTQSLEAYEMEFSNAIKSVQENFAQRGIDDDAGVNFAVEQTAAYTRAKDRAKIRIEADNNVREQQMAFLNTGLGQNPGSSMSQALSNQASQAGTLALSAAQGAGDAFNNAVTTTGKVIGDYLDSKKTV